ncbi:MAG: inorganic phosphate transporter [Candidatus Omnitrophota bacterium]|nr:MAG: inorganic phosphate transporter [Candidatus Omnitrophota bacterium]
MTFFITLLVAIYMGWSMGSNDAANCVGADIGSGDMKLKHGIIITCVFSLLGAILLGSNVIKTIGKGVVPIHLLPKEKADLIALTSLLGAAVWVTIATYKKFPVSTSHSIVGAVAGGGLALHTVVKWEKISQIVICWVLTPLGSAILVILIYPVLRRIFSLPLLKKFERPIITTSLYLTSMYLAFTWGANDVANATGVLIGTGRVSPRIAALIGGIAITIGVTTWGYRVIETVGFKITNLTPLMTIGIEIAASLNIQLYTHFGIPVSTSHSIVGAVWGVGLLHGIKAVNLRLFRDIVLAWAFTPVISGIITYGLLSLILVLK